MSNKKQDKIGRYRERALDPNGVPMRRLRAAKSLVELAQYSQRTCPIARRVANEFIKPDMPDDIRNASIRLLEAVAVGEAQRLATVRQQPVVPVETADEEVERVLNGEAAPLPVGIKMQQQPEKPVPQPKVERQSIAITTFEEACPYIQGLAEFDFADPRGIDVADVPWMNFQKRFMESIGEIIIPHALYAEIGGIWTKEQRCTWPVEKMKAAVVGFLNRNADASISGYQYKITDWRVVPIGAVKIELGPESTQVEYTGSPDNLRQFSGLGQFSGARDFTFNPDHSQPPSIAHGQSLPELRITCCICRAIPPGFDPPPHDCRKFQA